MTPKTLVAIWVQLFNRGDEDGLAELYTEDAVNHQMPNLPVNGKKAIRQMYADEFSQAEMTCIIVQILEDGNWAVLEWCDPKGMRGCGFFEVINGKIARQRGYWDKLTFARLHQTNDEGV